MAPATEQLGGTSDAWLHDARLSYQNAGVALFGTDSAEASLPSFLMAICYGSDTAMMWAGMALFLSGSKSGDMAVVMAGMGWLGIAVSAHVDGAIDAFTHAFNDLPADLQQAWRTCSPYAWAGVAVH